MEYRSAIGLSAFLAVLLSVPAYADGPAPADQPTLQLGVVSVTGERDVIGVLRSIKLALKTPYSDDPAHADDMVCRIDKQLGEAKEYLDCGINRDLSKRRDVTQLSAMSGTYGTPAGTNTLQYYLAAQPQHHIRVPVNGGNLQAVLQQIPDAPAVVAAAPGTAAAPTAATTAKAPGK